MNQNKARVYVNDVVDNKRRVCLEIANLVVYPVKKGTQLELLQKNAELLLHLLEELQRAQDSPKNMDELVKQYGDFKFYDGSYRGERINFLMNHSPENFLNVYLENGRIMVDAAVVRRYNCLAWLKVERPISTAIVPFPAPELASMLSGSVNPHYKGAIEKIMEEQDVS